MTDKKNCLDALLTQEVRYLFYIFDNQLRLVGGCVRDFLIRKKINDIDLATPLTPDEMIVVLKKHKVSYFLTGIKHGTITVVLNGKSFEITTLRLDINTDGRHARVCFLKDYKQDALRRDFTVNALYMDCDGSISDYTNGLQDLKNKKICFIGDPDERIQEDYLRILRYFRFVSRFGVNNIDEKSLLACSRQKDGLLKISVERIRTEIMLLLKSPFVIEVLSLMAKYKILDILLPEYDIGRLKRFIFIYPQSTVLERLAVLSFSTGILKWKWSNAQKKQLLFYQKNIVIPKNINQAKYLLWQMGKSEFLFHLYKQRLTKPMPMKTFYLLENLKKPIFNIKGADFCRLGYSGSQIGVLLKQAEKKWVQMSFCSKKSLVIDAVLNYNRKK